MRKKRKKKTFLVLILLIISFLLGYSIKTEVFLDLKSLTELSTLNYIKVEPKAWVQGENGIVALKSDCWELIAYTEKSQAISIARGLEKKIEFRPLTHDLIKDAFDFFKIKILMVKISGIKDNTFLAKTILQQGYKIISLDSRPSDGIAIAVRYDAPIYIKKDLLENYGRKIC